MDLPDPEHWFQVEVKIKAGELCCVYCAPFLLQSLENNKYNSKDSLNRIIFLFKNDNGCLPPALGKSFSIITIMSPRPVPPPPLSALMHINS